MTLIDLIEKFFAWLTGKEVESAALATKPYEVKLAYKGSSKTPAWNKTVKFPASGKFVCESHYATQADLFAGERLFPNSTTEMIGYHLTTSLLTLKKWFPNATLESVYNASWKNQWTPPENGKAGQTARGNTRPTVLEEMFQANMMFASGELPKAGTRFLIMNKQNGKACVVQMGYEVGPSSPDFLGGCTPEVHFVLDANNSTNLEISYLENQSSPLGPVQAARKEELEELLISHVPEYGDKKSEDVKTLQKRLNQLGYQMTVDGDFGPRTEAAVKEIQLANKDKSFIGTGVIGDKTLALLKLKIRGLSTGPINIEDKNSIESLCKKQLEVALSEIGVSETNNPSRVIEYHSTTSLAKSLWKVATAWCASFKNWVDKKCGIKGTGTAWARDYLSWGVKLSAAIPGCTLVFERNAPGGDSHVTIWTGRETATHYECVGGNQSNSVNKSWYSKKDLLGMRAPKAA